MDCRVTLNAKETFVEMLTAAHQSGQKVSLLIDENGITRAEGIIRAMHIGEASPFIELDNGNKVQLNKLVAVNGVFLPAYGEC